MLTWDDTLTLIETTYDTDDLGQPIAKETKTEVCCCRIPTPRNEYYKAGQNNIEVSETLTIHPYEYNGERIAVFGGKRMKIVRTYPKNLEELELTCTERLGDKNG